MPWKIRQTLRLLWSAAMLVDSTRRNLSITVGTDHVDPVKTATVFGASQSPDYIDTIGIDHGTILIYRYRQLASVDLQPHLRDDILIEESSPPTRPEPELRFEQLDSTFFTRRKGDCLLTQKRRNDWIAWLDSHRFSFHRSITF